MNTGPHAWVFLDWLYNWNFKRNKLLLSSPIKGGNNGEKNSKTPDAWPSWFAAASKYRSSTGLWERFSINTKWSNTWTWQVMQYIALLAVSGDIKYTYLWFFSFLKNETSNYQKLANRYRSNDIYFLNKNHDVTCLFYILV